jgi:hypothetical protein
LVLVRPEFCCEGPTLDDGVSGLTTGLDQRSCCFLSGFAGGSFDRVAAAGGKEALGRWRAFGG